METAHALSGGCINEAYSLVGNGERYFVKLNQPGGLAMFEAEAAALAEIAASDAIRVPRPVTAGADASHSWLVLEYVEFARPAAQTSAMLGEQLAAMHRCTAQAFGWKRDNTIGATPQPNPREADWATFFGRHRLGHQLQLAEANSAPGRLLDSGLKLAESVPTLLAGHAPRPSLLHGDLWGGNWAADSAGAPIIFDPASYYGDREADLAMTELFGGFDKRFYQSYESAWPTVPGYEIRKGLYNLYHVLNHFNLFGGGYAAQAQDMIDRLIAAVS